MTAMPVPAEVEFAQFAKIDLRVGRVTAVDDFPEARRPAWKLTVDFGPEIGERRCSAQIRNYEPQPSHWMNRRFEAVWLAQ